MHGSHAVINVHRCIGRIKNLRPIPSRKIIGPDFIIRVGQAKNRLPLDVGSGWIVLEINAARWIYPAAGLVETADGQRGGIVDCQDSRFFNDPAFAFQAKGDKTLMMRN